MVDVRRYQLNARPMKIALSPSGRLFIVLESATDGDRTITLACHDLDGQQLWVRHLSTAHLPLLRIADNDTVWVGGGTTLDQWSSDGTQLQSLPLQWQRDEELGSFLLAPSGYYVCSKARRKPTTTRPRVFRCDWDGHLRWSTVLPIQPVAYEGVVEMGVRTGWKMQPMRPWLPKSWQPDYHEPLLLAGSRLLVSFVDFSSGIGFSYGLDAQSGDLLWTTRPGPTGSKAIVAPGQFLIGSQGYGAFDTYLYADDGAIVQQWPSHGYVVLNETGQFRLAEMENVIPSKMHFGILEQDGSVRKGPHLDDYYTTYPVMTRDGITAFWRSGVLIVIDHDLEQHVLYADSQFSDRALMSRMLLSHYGHLIFTLDQELWIVDAGLGPLASSVWPCGSGNLQGNPVLMAQTD
jgi:hypothetical protein